VRDPECRYCPFLAWRILALHVGVGAVCGDWRCMCSLKQFSILLPKFSHCHPQSFPGLALYVGVGVACQEAFTGFATITNKFMEILSGITCKRCII
jgi:hypothetical protein